MIKRCSACSPAPASSAHVLVWLFVLTCMRFRQCPIIVLQYELHTLMSPISPRQNCPNMRKLMRVR